MDRESVVLDSSQLFLRYTSGDQAAASEIFDRYVERLVALAATRLAPALRRRIDPDDIVQSAFRSFFVRARQSDYALIRGGDLWRLLAAITLHKVRDQVDRHRAARRDYRRERGVSVADSDSQPDSQQIPAESPASAGEVAALEQLQAILGQLPCAVRDALALRLAGNTVAEIAVAMQRSERTVRRFIDEARHLLSRELMFRDSAL